MSDSSLVWAAALGLSVAGSVGGLLVAGILLLFGPEVRNRVVPSLVSYAVGTLLGAAALGLMPQALETLSPQRAFAALLGGILTFFVLEKLVLLRHCHDDAECKVHESTVTLVIIGDAVHTFVDGVAIAATTLVSVPLGISTALAAIAHEIPQEAGDFGILLSAGHSRKKALMLNATSALGGVAGALAMLLLGSAMPNVAPYVLAFAAGNFLYVAMADLIPHLHRGETNSNSVRQVILIALGLLTIGLVDQLLH
ncbi:MAG: ZIP family metal transporter [Acidobacteria bacterium]|nr:ZIP family metal transporter [Acidobacteriota bacterium]